MSVVIGILRIKNEERWIDRVLAAALPVCDQIFVLDDHSEDGTRDMVREFRQKVALIESPFSGLDEARDKELLLDRAMSCVPPKHRDGDATSPYWALAIDGDEILERGAADKIRASISVADSRDLHAFKMQIFYLWDSETAVRVDGVYRNFARPSLFRLMNRAFRFQRTPWGATQPDGSRPNFHCSSIPQELLHHAQTAPICPARIMHMGYIDSDLRRRKFDWYSKIDPNNEAEGRYLHCIQGDPGGPAADARLRHAGPMMFESISF